MRQHQKPHQKRQKTCQKHQKQFLQRQPLLNLVPKAEQEASKTTKITDYMTTKPSNTTSIEYLVDFITMDMHPFSAVEGDGFKKLILHINPQFPKSAFNRHEVRLAAQVKLESSIARWKNVLLQDTDEPSITLDLWTSKNSVCVVGITVHWISKDWKLHKLALDVQELGSDHTADNIVDALKITFAKWGIRHVVAATERLGNLTEWDLDCFAHKLNNCVNNTIENTPAAKEIIGNVRTVVRHFRKSHKSWYKLVDDYFARNNKNPTRPIIDSKTRWFSTYLMLKWFHDVYDSLDEIIPTIDKLKDITFTRNDIKVINDFHALLRPLADATLLLEGDTYPTLAWAVEVDFLLKKHVLNFNAKSTVGESLRASLEEALHSRLQPEKFKPIVWMATLLTPSVRDSSCILYGHKKSCMEPVKGTLQ